MLEGGERNEEIPPSTCELQSNDFWRKGKLNHGFASVTLRCAPFRLSVSPLPDCPIPSTAWALSSRRPREPSARLPFPSGSVLTPHGAVRISAARSAGQEHADGTPAQTLSGLFCLQFNNDIQFASPLHPRTEQLISKRYFSSNHYDCSLSRSLYHLGRSDTQTFFKWL